MTAARTFGEWCREYRMVHGLTQRELAEKLCCPLVNVSAWEVRDSRPKRTAALEAAVRALDESAVDFLRWR